MKTVDTPQRPNPFPGLRPFRSDEHHLFFGREEQTAALLQLLRTNRFLAVVGTSGSGKSSLVRAGMIAELHGGTMTQAGSTWEVMLLRPGGNPIENLARAFVEADLYDPDDPSTLPRLLATLNRSRFGLVEAMKQCAVVEPGTNLLVVVDQFEELFRFRQQGVDSEETAAAFVNLLLTASEQAECPIYVTITMRSDYLGDCSEIPGLAEAVNEGEYLIPRLLRDQKRDAIEKPIGVGGARISPMLVQRLLNDVGDDPDQLPVLQHALMRMWDAWSSRSDHDRPIDFDDFEATGGLGAALSNHADEIYESLPDDRHRSVCEKIFKALTEKGDDNRGIRRPNRLAQLQTIAGSDRDTVTTVLDAYRGAGVTFLMPGAEVALTDRTVLDLSHESLMRGWQRLRLWVEDEAQSARVFRRLLDTARLWKVGKAGLFRDPDLQIALSWREQEAPNAEWAEQYGGHFETAIQFLETSNAEADAERQAREAARQHELEQAQELAESRKQRLLQQQRAARKLRTMIAGLAAVAVVAVLACLAALVANQRAVKLAAESRLNELKAKANATRAEQSQRETASALTVVESQKAKAESAERSARSAEEDGRKLLYTTDMRLAPFVWKDDRSTAEQLRVLLAKHVPDPRPAGNHDAGAAALKPDLRGFEWHYYQHLLDSSAAVFSGFGASLAGGAFTSHGELVTLDQNGQLRRWDLSSQNEGEGGRRDLPRAQFHVLSPDGRLAAQALGNKVHIFETSTGKETFTIDSPDDRFRQRHLVFSGDSNRFVIADDTFRWLSAATGEVVAAHPRQFPFSSSLALSADGLTLAQVGYGNLTNRFLILRLDANTRKVILLAQDLKAEEESLSVAALSPDGQRIAVGCQLAGLLSVFDTATGRTIARYGSAHASPISAIAFSIDGTKLATADTQGTIKIWADAETLTSKSGASRTLKGHQETITTVGFSTDGKRLVSGSADKTARVWDLENAGADIRPLERSSGDCFVAQFSPDGQLIAAADGNRVRLWDAATARLVRDLSAGDESRLVSVAFSPADSNLLAVGHGGQANVSYVSLWDIRAGTEIARLPGATDLPGFQVTEFSGQVGALTFSPDGKYLVAGFGAKLLLNRGILRTPLKVWEVATRRLAHRLDGHTNYCVSLDFSRDGRLLASGSRDGTALIWSTETWKALRTLQNPDKGGPFSEPDRGMVDGVAFSPDGKTLAMASRVGNVQLWDVATGKLLESLKGHSSSVQAVVFSPDGRTLASGGGDQTVRLWNVETRRELMKLDSGGIELGSVLTLAFSPDGQHLLTGGEHVNAAVWSAGPILWDDPDRAANNLRFLLKSNAGFPSRIRMLSENLRLHEALAKLGSNDVRVRAALAAAQANWHASRKAWPDAVAAYDRLVATDPRSPEAWLRTPGLLRLATALVHQNRPRDAASLLAGGAKRRRQDGLPDVANDVALGLVSATVDGRAHVTELLPGSPASRSELVPGDVITKVNEIELTEDAAFKIGELLKADAGKPVRLTVRHRGRKSLDVIQLAPGRFLHDPATGDLLHPLRAVVEERLVREPRNAGLLALRAELAGQWSDRNAQIDDFSAAIDVLSQQSSEAANGNLQRLYQRRGDAYLATQQWKRAADDYARVVTDTTTDEELLTNQATALAEVMFSLERSSDPTAAARERRRSAMANLDDPWQKLAVGYQLDDKPQKVDQLVARHPKLAGRIGDAFTREPYTDWHRALDIYSRGIAAVSSNVDLLSKRARAYEALHQWDAAAADWARAATGNPDEAGLRAEFARRLAAAGEGSLAKAQFDQSEARYARSLRDDPENDLVAEELAQLLFDKQDNQSARRWTVLTPSEMTSKGGATLSKLPDESILASGKNSLGDAYTIVARAPVSQVRAIRLEALTHDSLPNHGPGRSEPTRGNVAMVNFKITAHIPGTQPRPIEVSRVAADHHYLELTAIHWNIEGGQGHSHTAVYLAKQPVDCKDGTRLEFQMGFYAGGEWPFQNLGRFRLSVSSDPAALDEEQTRFAARTLTDPWAKLGIAYAVNGRNEEASRYLAQALERADGDVARKPILELAARFGDLLPALIQRRPDDPQPQLALARNRLERGKQRLAASQPAKAQADLEQSRDVFARLRTKFPDSRWTVLTPTAMKSQGGETLAVEPDGSLLVSGPNPDRAVYALTLRTELPAISAFRLETIPDPRLPGGGAGRFGNGNFHLGEFTAAFKPDQTGARSVPMALGTVLADAPTALAFGFAKSIDGDPKTYWDTHPQVKDPHWAVFVLKSPMRVDGGTVTVTLDSGISIWNQHGLGRFRLLATSASDPLLWARLDFQDSELMDMWSALASAHVRQGHDDEALASFTEALALATDRAGRGRIIAEAATREGVLAKLAERASGDVLFQAELARHLAEHGDARLGESAHAHARALLEEKLAKEPDSSPWAAELADLLLPPIDAKTKLMVPTSETEAVPWRFSTKPPPADWSGEAFDDSTWTTSPGAFGGNGSAPGLVMRTEWKTSDIWLRRKFEWKPDRSVQSLLARVIHDDGFELFVNGQLILSRPDYKTVYMFYVADAKALGLLKPGTNTMAVHCFSTLGAQYIDVGLYGLSSNPRVTQGRLAATTIADPWARLAAAYHVLGDQPALERLLHHHPAAVSGIGNLYAENQDWGRAIAEYDKAITPECKDARIFAARAEAHEKLEHWDLAAADWGNADLYAGDKTVRYGTPSFPPMERRAFIHGRLQQYDKQVVDFTELLKPERFGDHTWSFASRGEAYDHLRQWDKARVDFDRAIKLAPESERGIFHFRRADHFAPQGQWKQAVDDLRQAYQKPADFTDTGWPRTEWWGLRDAALIFGIAGDVENYARAAAELYRKQSAGTPNPEDSRWTVLTMLLFPEMITKENRARLLELAGYTDDYWKPRLTAAIAFRSGDPKKAAELFDANGGGPPFLFLAAMAHYERGNRDRAKQRLEEGNRWLQEQRAKEPGAGVPRSNLWQDWAAVVTLQYEASDLILGPGTGPTKAAERVVGDASFQAALARHFAARGNAAAAKAARAKAREVFERQRKAEPDNTALASELADFLWSTLPPVESFWIDDALPHGANPHGDTPWEFVGKPDHPVFRGAKSTRRQAKGSSQHFFDGATPGLTIGEGAKLFAYVYLDPKDPPRAVMLQFLEGTNWAHRAYWGEDVIPYARGFTGEINLSMGPLPQAGQWVRLEVEPARVGLPAGTVLSGWAFSQYGGTCYWDAAGIAGSFKGPWQKLAATYHRLGDQQAFDALVKQHPDAASSVGDLYAASQDWERAIAAYRALVTDERADVGVLTKLASAYQSAGRTREAVPYLARASAANPKDTLLSLKVAALQAWFGQEKEYAETRRRLLGFAKGTTDSGICERVAKACSILPSPDAAERDAALALARAGVKINPNEVWNQVALGMAEYRSGHFAAANAAMLAAVKIEPNSTLVASLSGFYRALSLFQLGQHDEARKLAIETSAQMKPYPKDGQNPLTDGAFYDNQIIWLAYKEAKAMIQFAAPVETKGK